MIQINLKETIDLICLPVDFYANVANCSLCFCVIKNHLPFTSKMTEEFTVTVAFKCTLILLIEVLLFTIG